MSDKEKGGHDDPGQEKKPPNDPHLVEITVDGTEHSVRAGDWVVADLKSALGIDAAKVLAQITPHGLNDLDDGATIKVHSKDQFMTHARSGGSS